MKTKYLFYLLGVLLLLQFSFSTTSASAADPSEMTGQTINDRWLGSYNTVAPRHSFCLDGFKGHPRASYNWTSTNVRAPKSAYLLWRYGRNPDVTTATALSWYIHGTPELGHDNVNGYTDLPKTALPSGVQTRATQIQIEANKNAGPYKLFLSMQNNVVGNRLALGKVKLVGNRGQVIKDGFGNRKIKVTLSGGRFASGQASRYFHLANGVGAFQYRRASSSVTKITGKAGVKYGPIGVKRLRSNVPTAQRIVSFMAGNNFRAAGSTRLRNNPPPETANIQLIKHGEGESGPSYPLEGAVFAINKSTSTPGPNANREATDENGELVFKDLEINTAYYLHEISAPGGHKKPSPSNPIPVTTGGKKSTVNAHNGQPIINPQTIFDLALRKYVHAVNGNPTGENGIGEPSPTPVKVGDIVNHRIMIFNQGETDGWAEKIIDYIPAGYDFVAELNEDWTYDEFNHTASIDRSSLVIPANPNPSNPHGTQSFIAVDIYLKVNSKIYTSASADAGVNFAEICEDGNNFDYPDIDSTPDCDKDNDVVGGDNIVDNSSDDEDDHDYDEIVPEDIPASTQATQFSKVDGLITDTLTTSVPMPGGLEVVFRVFANDECTGGAIYRSAPITTVEGVNKVKDPAGYSPATPGKYYWVASIINPTDETEYFRGVCGDPGEVSEIYSITTTATPSTQLGGKIRDLATVEGDIPSGTNIRFNLYSPNDIRCEKAPVYVSDLIPTESGKTEYQSEEVPTRENGIYKWVEELIDEDGRTVLTRGECGIENENSHVWNISTVATSKVSVGGYIYDTAKISGSIPEGAKVRFKLHAEDDNNCKDPIFVTSAQKVNGQGYYKSPKYKTKEAGEHYWVEELLDKSGDVIARGICGLENETSLVTSVKTTDTGKPGGPGSPNNPEAPPATVVDTPIPVTG